MLLIVDEAQTGLGRTGTIFASEQDAITLDILVLSKTLGAGIPLSAVTTTGEIAQRCDHLDFFFCTTRVNDPLAASVGLAVLDTVVENDLAERAKLLGDLLFKELCLLQSRYTFIGDVRGRVALLGVEIISTKKMLSDQYIASAILKRIVLRGLWMNLTTYG